MFVSHTDSPVREGAVWRRRLPGVQRRDTDQLLDGQDPTTVLRSDGLIGDLKKALAERMLNAELDVHLDSEARASSR